MPIRSAVYTDLWRPRAFAKAYDAGLVIAGSLFVALMAQLFVPLLYSPIPSTGQTFGVVPAWPFLPAAVIKATLAAMLLPAGWRLLRNRSL